MARETSVLPSDSIADRQALQPEEAAFSPFMQFRVNYLEPVPEALEMCRSDLIVHRLLCLLRRFVLVGLIGEERLIAICAERLV
jgi:hypothetical protein